MSSGTLDILDIRGSGSLSSLNLANNNLQSGGAKCLAPALRQSKLTVLNISENRIGQRSRDNDGAAPYVNDAAGVTALAKSIQDMGSLSSLTFNGGKLKYGSAGDWEDGEVVTIDTTMTEADFSRKKLGVAGAQILVAFMSTKLFEAKGSLSKLKMDRYELPVQEIKTATELDLSGKGLGDLDAIVIAALIKVQTIAQNRLVTNKMDPSLVGQRVVVLSQSREQRHPVRPRRDASIS